MFAPANAAHFTLHIDGIAHDLQVLEFHGREAISQPWRFDLELVSERPDLDLETLLNRPAFLAFAPDGAGVHGLVYRIAQSESGKRLTRYRLSLVPRLAYLAHRTNQRIFQHLSVPQIACRALKRHRADHQLAEGDSDQPLLRSGQFLDLAEHPRADWNQLWLLNEIHHEGKQPQVLEESISSDAFPPRPLGEGRGEGAAAGTDDFQQGYRNRFLATPSATGTRTSSTTRRSASATSATTRWRPTATASSRPRNTAPPTATARAKYAPATT